MNCAMPKLQRAFEAAGFTDVKTLLSSGNVLFSTGSTSLPAVEKKAEAAMEEHLGRPIQAYAYVKCGLGDFDARHGEMLRRGGYDTAFTTVTGSNGPGADPFTLKRYNVEPYPARTLELVLRGACDRMAVKDSRSGTTARRAFNRVLRTTSK